MSYEQNLFPYTKNFKINFFKIALVFIVFCLLGASLSCNAIVFQSIEVKIAQSSINFFLIGSTAILGGGTLEWLIWLANPISLFSIIIFLYNDNNLKKALWLNFIALILSSSFRSWNEILVSESGATGKIISFEKGYYLWVLSILVLFIFQSIYFFLLNLKAKNS